MAILPADQRPLTAAQVSAVRNQLIRFINDYESDAQALTDQIGVLATTAADSPAVVTLKATKSRVDNLIGLTRTVAQTGRYWNNTPLTARKVRIMYLGLGEALKNYGAAVNEVSKFNTLAIFKTAGNKLVGLGQDLIDLALTGPKLLINLVIFGAVGLTAVFALPPILRAITAYRKGGATAALESSTESLESARGSVTSAAKRAGSVAAKTGAAYASGGATLAVPGMNPLSGHHRPRRKSHR